MTDQSVSPPLLTRRRFYLVTGLIMAAMIAAGFSPYFGALLAGRLEREIIVHLHAVVFVGWVVLFLTQAALGATGRIGLHRKLGRLGIGYAVVVVLVGLVASFNQLAGGIAAGKAEAAQAFLLIPIVDMLLFSALFAAAIAYRRRTEVHRRLMLVTANYLLIAPAGRVDMEAFIAMQPSFFAIWFSPILLAMAYDAVARRRLHPVYPLGLAVFALSMLRLPLSETDTWMSIARALSGLVS